LRKKVDVQLQKGSTHNHERSVMSTCSTENRGLSGAKEEEQLKKRLTRAQSLSVSVLRHVDDLQQASFKLQDCISALTRASGAMSAAIAVVDKRLQLRSTRPPEEMVDDDFQKSLEAERVVLERARKDLAGRVQAAQDMLDPIETTKVDLQHSRLNLHVERTCDLVEELLGYADQLKEQTLLVCMEGYKALSFQQTQSGLAQRNTQRHMKQRIAHTLQLRRCLEEEMREAKQMVRKLVLDLERKRKALQIHYAMPERGMKQEQGEEIHLEMERFEMLSPHIQEQLAQLRAKIKSSSYTGANGRQLDVVFGRFDRDGSGNLEEDELRKALRRTMKIPPALVSDAEISALCALLDADRSGTVSIGEIVEFIDGDLNVEKEEEECRVSQELLDQMRRAQKKSLQDLRCKNAALRIDEACSRVTAAMALDLDAMPGARKTKGGSTSGQGKISLPPPQSPGKPAVWSPGRSGKQKKDRGDAPLGEAKLDQIRSKIKAAAYTGQSGRQLDVIFSRFDKDGSGQLDHDEFRKALRRTLKISPTVICDDEIFSLCAFLDTDRSGTVSVEEIVKFVGAEPTVSQRTGKSVNGTALEPMKTADSSGMASSRPESSITASTRANTADSNSVVTVLPKTIDTARPNTVDASMPSHRLKMVDSKMESSSPKENAPPSRSNAANSNRPKTADTVNIENASSKKVEGGGYPTSQLASHSKQSDSLGRQDTPRKRKQAPALAPEVLEKFRAKIKAAAYTGHSGRQLDVLFSRFDKDRSGQLEFDEVRVALRRTLRITPSAISDDDIVSLCAMLDADRSGTVGINELVEFVGAEVETPRRTNKPAAGTTLAPLAAKSDGGKNGGP